VVGDGVTGAVDVAAGAGVGVAAGADAGATDEEAGTEADGEGGVDVVDGVDGVEIAGVALEAGAARDWGVSFPPPQAARLKRAKKATSVWRFNENSCDS
jgi:hypothetical protein